jgi:hypothetical protein
MSISTEWPYWTNLYSKFGDRPQMTTHKAGWLVVASAVVIGGFAIMNNRDEPHEAQQPNAQQPNQLRLVCRYIVTGDRPGSLDTPEQRTLQVLVDGATSTVTTDGPYGHLAGLAAQITPDEISWRDSPYSADWQYTVDRFTGQLRGHGGNSYGWYGHSARGSCGHGKAF